MVASIFKLIRWKNLLMILFIQLLIRYSFIIPLNLPHILNDWYYALGMLCSIMLAAGGYIINDLHDLEPDQHNKPERITIGKKISEGLAWNLYFASLIIAALSAYFLSEESGLDNLWLIAPLASVLLYAYAVDLKKRAFLGNFVVGILSALPIFLIGIFDILPAATVDKADQVKQSFEVILAYTGFAFWTTLIREMVKDLEDRQGDSKSGFKTMAVLLNPLYTKIIISVMLLVLIGLCTAYGLSIWAADHSSSLYVLLAVSLPFAFLIWLLWKAQEAHQFKSLSNKLKLAMLLGILSMPFFTLSLVLQWP